MPKVAKIQLFDIQFSKNVFYAGELMTGCVKLELDRPIKANQLKLDIYGRTNTKWKETCKYNEKRIFTYYDERVYLDHTFVFWEKRHEKDVLDKGRYSYNFGIEIPANSPSTFAFPPLANITYYGKAVLCREKYKSDESRVQPFTVLSVVNLNLDPQINLPLETLVAETKGKITMKILMSKSGFFPGETIKLEARLTNNSSKKITKIETILVQNVLLLASEVGQTNGRLGEKKKDAVISQSGLSVDMAPKTPNRQVFWDFKIPATSPTLKSCPIIIISYNLVIKLHMSGLFSDPLKATIPITLGTIAIGQKQETTMPSVPSLSVEQPIPVEYSTEWLMKHNLIPPPAYSEDMKE